MVQIGPALQGAGALAGAAASLYGGSGSESVSPTFPDFLRQPLEDLITRGETASQRVSQEPFSGPFFAPPDPLQLQAIDQLETRAQDLQGVSQPIFDLAAGLQSGAALQGGPGTSFDDPFTQAIEGSQQPQSSVAPMQMTQFQSPPVHFAQDRVFSPENFLQGTATPAPFMGPQGQVQESAGTGVVPDIFTEAMLTPTEDVQPSPEEQVILDLLSGNFNQGAGGGNQGGPGATGAIGTPGDMADPSLSDVANAAMNFGSFAMGPATAIAAAIASAENPNTDTTMSFTDFVGQMMGLPDPFSGPGAGGGGGPGSGGGPGAPGGGNASGVGPGPSGSGAVGGGGTGAGPSPF